MMTHAFDYDDCLRRPQLTPHGEAVSLLAVAEFVRIQTVHDCLNSHESSYEKEGVPKNSQPQRVWGLFCIDCSGG